MVAQIHDSGEQIGRAMIGTAKRGSAKSVLESADINQG
jgi:hypothetical protein